MNTETATQALTALAQSTRLDIFRCLVQAGTAGRAAGEIADLLKVSAPTLSFHMKILKFSGLVKSRREGRNLIYSANFERMNALMAFLTFNCCEGESCDIKKVHCDTR